MDPEATSQNCGDDDFFQNGCSIDTSPVFGQQGAILETVLEEEVVESSKDSTKEASCNTGTNASVGNCRTPNIVERQSLTLELHLEVINALQVGAGSWRLREIQDGK